MSVPWPLDRLLPKHLLERSRLVKERSLPETGQYVVYWMRTAVRLHENPALDVARALADACGVPFFVYHALSERYPFASDRHHAFVLAGARDVAEACAEADIGYAFHLEREGHRGPHLKTLAEGAACVVTEEMPVAPLRPWTEGLAAGMTTPVVVVDTACVVPMLAIGKAFDRAFAFRRETEALRNERIGRTWPKLQLHNATLQSTPFLPELPFEPVDLSANAASLSSLIATCAIDHGVAPVADTLGGTNPGYQRWKAWRDVHLSTYADRRNEPLDSEGSSRMSAYLHYGFVSPFRLAREAHEHGGPGADKFLDELLVWRALAYSFCLWEPHHDRFTGLPAWAQKSLQQHDADPRTKLMTWETLSRARTGDELWDTAQRSLLIHGELHNNVRMTWGKAFLGWTRDSQEALRLSIDLNHRYALDGRDPASYGGLLWCFGQFDRPHPPERPIFGNVRPRATATHAKRLDINRWRAMVDRPCVKSEGEPALAPRIAVIGAGVSGLRTARMLGDHGFNVRVFDRGRGPGGRAASKRSEAGSFDHGAQFFTARNPHFQHLVASWIQDDVVAPWSPKVVLLESGEHSEAPGESQRYVATPKMSRLIRHLAQDLEVETETEITELRRSGQGWVLRTASGHAPGPFDAVVLAMPPGQALRLLPADAQAWRARLESVVMEACWCVAVRFKTKLEPGFDAAFVKSNALSWVARNGSKPGREDGWWILHASGRWSSPRRDMSREEVGKHLLSALAEALMRDLPQVEEQVVHRWGFSEPLKPLEQDHFYSSDLRLGICGDWCGGPRVEGAWLSGTALSARMLAEIAAGVLTGEDQW